MRHFEKKHYITKTFLLCLNRQSNDLYTNLKTLDEKDCFEDEHTFGLALHQILTTVQKEWDEYNAEQEYKSVFLKAHRNHLSLTLREQNTLEYRQGEPPKKLQKPSHLLIVDDSQCTDLYSNARRDLLTHIVIKHRHIPITITLLAQSWTEIPRVIRLNTS